MDPELRSNSTERSGPRIRHEGDRLRGQTERRLIVGGFAIMALVGGAVLWARYGGTAAVVALSVILGGAGLMALLWLLLSAMEAWAKAE